MCQLVNRPGPKTREKRKLLKKQCLKMCQLVNRPGPKTREKRKLLKKQCLKMCQLVNRPKLRFGSGEAKPLPKRFQSGSGFA